MFYHLHPYLYLYLYPYIIMVRTRRSQLENISKEKLIEELISVEDISSSLSDLTSRFDDFFEMI